MSGPLSAYEASKPPPNAGVIRYHALKDAGKCVICGKRRPKTAVSRCRKCTKRHNLLSAQSRARKAERGLVAVRGRHGNEITAELSSVTIRRDVEAGVRCKTCHLLLPHEGCPDSIAEFATARRDAGEPALPRRRSP